MFRHRLLLLFVPLAGMTCDPNETMEIAAPRSPALTPTMSSLVTTSETKIVAPNGKPSDLFGFSAALSENTAVIGAPYEDSGGTDAGAAYVFARTNNTWSFEQKLVAADANAGRWFGYSVAIDGDTIVIGSPKADGVATSSGAAYVFTRTNGVWLAKQKISAEDAELADMFGQSVAIAGSTLVIGAPQEDAKGIDAGAAYVFVSDNGTYQQQKKLFSADEMAGDRLGASVAIAGETALVGAPDADALGASSGAAYVFVRAGTLWSQQKKLLPASGSVGDAFGAAVSLHGDLALVGAPLANVMGADSGAAYLFSRTGLAWNTIGPLMPSGLSADDRFGSSVSVGNDSAIVGALLDDTKGSNAGAAYVFTRKPAEWSQDVELLASDGTVSDAFGFAVAISADTALVSAYLDDDQGTSSGSVYFYELKREIGDPCSVANECASGYCADGVCCDKACNAGPCDGCSVATGSISDGVCTHIEGATCDDGNACTVTDTCFSGQCMGGEMKVCPGEDACNFAGSCDVLTGTCNAENKADGTTCDDLDACTLADACRGGVCQGASNVECPAINECHEAGACDPLTGQCTALALPEGTVCPGGSCVAGECIPNEWPDGGQPTKGVLVTGGGCDCRVNTQHGRDFWWFGAGAVIWVATVRRARRARKNK